jgi:hypothetical protein
MTIYQKVTAIFLFPLLTLLHCAPREETLEETQPKEDIIFLLPQSDELEKWEEFFSPQHVVGEDLYSLINGGAEIYHEYGFRQAVNHSYESTDGTSINVEIYEMEDPESAFGIYSFKTGDEGELVDIGNDALLESYYLNFWKGNYLVTLVGFDEEPETRSGILELARLIDAKIEGGGLPRPDIVRYLPPEGLNASTVVYLKGNMALRNNYEIAPGNIFGVEEGVIGEYGDIRVFIFNYEDEETAMERFKNGTDQLNQQSKLADFALEGNAFSATDAKGLSIFGKPFQHTIVIVVGGEEATPKITAEVERSITGQ